MSERHPRAAVLRSSLVLILLLWARAPAVAQLRELSTDRPDQTESPATLIGEGEDLRVFAGFTLRR